MKDASIVSTPMPSRTPVGEPVVEPTVPVTPEATTPVETPAVEPVVEPTVPATPAPESLDLTEPVVAAKATGNDTFDKIASVLSEKNVPGVDALFKNITDTGEVSLADTVKIVEALGETMGGLVINQLQGEVGNIKAAKQAKSQVVLDYAAQKFGVAAEQSAGVWKDIQAFVKTPESGFTAEDRKAMTQMIQAGGMQAELVLDRIHAKFTTASNFTQPANLVQGDSSVGSTFVGLTQAEYTAQMSKVVQEFGYDSKQAQSLRDTRKASLARGHY